ncbi:MAG: S24/S26 family peptidase [Pseudomonadota bacterium]
MNIGLYRVSGHSMRPSFEDGDYVVSWRRSTKQSYREGDVIVLNHPSQGRLIKRVQSVDASGDYLQANGENRMSVSMHDLGKISCSEIVGKVLYRFSPGNNSIIK